MAMLKLFRWSFLAWAFCIPAVCPVALAGTQEAYKVEETRLASLDANGLSPVFSRDGRHLAYVIPRGQKWSVVVDGQIGAEYDGIGRGSLLFSPDGTRVAYRAKKGKKWVVVVDGQAGAEYDDIAAGSLTFSPDGKHLAYVAFQGDGLLAVVDGQAGVEYEGIGTGTPIFSFSVQTANTQPMSPSRIRSGRW